MEPTRQLVAADWSGAAWLLGCDIPAIRAVAEVETGPFGAFYPDGRPMILFERHLFHRETGGQYDASYPDVSHPVPGGYGPVARQYARLDVASSLNRVAALHSASWGAFQILGLNYQRAGYSTLQAFINAMYKGIDDHLRAFACFVHSDVALELSLRRHDWPTFKRFYNGPAANDYAAKLTAAYLKWSTVP